jgi:hypothetical protein
VPDFIKLSTLQLMFNSESSLSGRVWPGAFAVAAALALAGCAEFRSNACAPGLQRMMQAQLFFGRNIAGRDMVTDDEWRRFLDEEVSPRYPAGFSVADVDGQYRNAGRAIVRERSKQLLVVGPAGDETKLDAIRDAYKRRFKQESVLLVESPVCAAF